MRLSAAYGGFNPRVNVCESQHIKKGAEHSDRESEFCADVVIDSLTLDNPIRAEFDRLHVWSENFEGAVLLLGLIAVFRTAQELH